MAINDAVQGLEITITHDGEALIEYEDDTVMPEDRTTMRFIESKSDQAFAVKLKLEQGTQFRGDSLACEIKIDGTLVISPLLAKKDCRHRAYVDVRKGCPARDGMTRKFEFSSVETGTFRGIRSRSSLTSTAASDGRAFAGEVDEVKALGSIVVEVEEVNLGHRVRACNYDHISSITNEVLSEKALKGSAVSHGMVWVPTCLSRTRRALTEPNGLGAPMRIEVGAGNTWTTSVVEGAPRPVAKYVFFYRSMGTFHGSTQLLR